jgi:hypothetical protein
MFYDRRRKGWPFNTGDCLIEMIAWTGLTVHIICIMYDVSEITHGKHWIRNIHNLVSIDNEAHISIIPATVVPISSQDLDFQRHMSWSFCIQWVQLRWEMIARLGDISGIDCHHCLNCLLVELIVITV